MSIATKIDEIAAHLQLIRQYVVLIDANNFEEATVTDMKGNAKDTCDTAKADIDAIKSLIDEWS